MKEQHLRKKRKKLYTESIFFLRWCYNLFIICKEVKFRACYLVWLLQ